MVRVGIFTATGGSGAVAQPERSEIAIAMTRSIDLIGFPFGRQGPSKSRRL
jgi:hypothetical protein